MARRALYSLSKYGVGLVKQWSEVGLELYMFLLKLPENRASSHPFCCFALRQAVHMGGYHNTTSGGS
jgi:hypothetical protein